MRVPNFLLFRRHFRDRHFVGVTLNLRHAYTRCTMTDCVLVWNGRSGIELASNNIQRPRFKFTGPAANTLDFLRRMLGPNNQGFAATFGLAAIVRSPKPQEMH